MIRCPRCGLLASQTDDHELKRAIKFLTDELKHGPRTVQELNALSALREFIGDESLSQAAHYLGLNQTGEGALIALSLDDLDSVVDDFVNQQPFANDLDSRIETTASAPLEFELNIDSVGAEISGTVRISNACGNCGRPLLDYHFTVHERPEDSRFRFQSPLDQTIGELRRDHLLNFSSEWFQQLAPERQAEIEKQWDHLHRLGVEVKQAIRTVKRDRGDHTYYGFELMYVVSCTCGGYRFQGHFEDSVHTGSMRSLVTKRDILRGSL
jgi:hypothetical protein